MKVLEFVEEFNNARDKNSIVKKHIVTDYIPYEQKISECRNIINVALYKEVNGRKVFMYDSPAVYHLFILSVMRNYTDIDMYDEEDFGYEVRGFNALEQYNIFSCIAENIGQDYKGFQTVLSMMTDDAVQNNSLVPFLDTKFEALAMVVNSFKDVLTPENLEQLMQKVEQE